MGGRGAAFEGKNYSYSVEIEEKKIYKDSIETAIVVNDSGNILFRESSGATNYVLFTDDQLNKMAGATLTHNHPSNSTFSSADIDLLTVRDLKVIRATGKDRTYQLKKMKDTAEGENFRNDFRKAQVDNKKITDADYRKLEKEYNNGGMSYSEYVTKINGLNKKLNGLNSEWLKNNAKNYGYRYSVIERRK